MVGVGSQMDTLAPSGRQEPAASGLNNWILGRIWIFLVSKNSGTCQFRVQRTAPFDVIFMVQGPLCRIVKVTSGALAYVGGVNNSSFPPYKCCLRFWQSWTAAVLRPQGTHVFWNIFSSVNGKTFIRWKFQTSTTWDKTKLVCRAILRRSTQNVRPVPLPSQYPNHKVSSQVSLGLVPACSLWENGSCNVTRTSQHATAIRKWGKQGPKGDTGEEH